MIQQQLDRPNPLLLMQQEFETELTRLRNFENAVKVQKERLKQLFKRMHGRALQAYMDDEVIDLADDDSSSSDSSLEDYQSPPPGLGALQLQIPIPFPPPPMYPRRPTPHPLFLQGRATREEEDQLAYPDGCLECRYAPERCENCVRRVFGPVV